MEWSEASFIAYIVNFKGSSPDKVLCFQPRVQRHDAMPSNKNTKQTEVTENRLGKSPL
jgi:hypothetical protein